MHAPKLSDVDLNLICRALDTLSEHSITLKNNIVAQIQEAQRPKEKPGKKK